MGGLFLIGLLVLLVIKLWPYLLALVTLWLVWRFLVMPVRDAHARELRDQLRHEEARRDIDRIAAETTRAMHAAAAREAGVIHTTAVEVEQ
jgi:flagellar biosynthesis/type III secretory pathway M-ring protein FliF/YscJ